MQFFPASLQNLSDQFARLPGIGGKTAQRLAFHVLEMPLEEAQAFADAILEAKHTVHTCPCCQNLTDQPTTEAYRSFQCSRIASLFSVMYCTSRSTHLISLEGVSHAFSGTS
mgnify:CR=1 FL=1